MNHLTADQIRALPEGGHAISVRLTRSTASGSRVVYEGPATVAISRARWVKGDTTQRLPDGVTRISAIDLVSPAGKAQTGLEAWPEADEEHITDSGVIILRDDGEQADYQTELFPPETQFAALRVQAAVARLRDLGREDLLARLAFVAEQFVMEATAVADPGAGSPPENQPVPTLAAPEGETAEALIRRVTDLMHEQGDALTPNELRAIRLMREQGAVLRFGQARVERKGRSGDDYFVPNTAGATPRNLVIGFVKVPWLAHFGLIHDIGPDPRGKRQYKFGPGPSTGELPQSPATGS